MNEVTTALSRLARHPNPAEPTAEEVARVRAAGRFGTHVVKHYRRMTPPVLLGPGGDFQQGYTPNVRSKANV